MFKLGRIVVHAATEILLVLAVLSSDCGSVEGFTQQLLLERIYSPRSSSTQTFTHSPLVLSWKQHLPRSILTSPSQFSIETTVTSDEDDANFLASLNITYGSSPEAFAAKLRARADDLKAEAKAMEQELEAARLSATQEKKLDIENMMTKLFQNNRPLTAKAVARILREERFSQEQLEILLESLYRRQKVASLEQLRINNNNNDPSQLVNQTAEVELVETYIQVLLDAASQLDDEQLKDNAVNRRWTGHVANQLRSRINEWNRAEQQELQRKLAANVQAAVQNNMTVTEYMRKSLGLAPLSVQVQQQPATTTNSNSTSSSSSNNATLSSPTQQQQQQPEQQQSKQPQNVPLWVPSQLIPYVMDSKYEMDKTDIKYIQENILTQTRFFCTSCDYIPAAAIFRGNMRPGPSVPNPVEVANERTFPQSVLTEIQAALARKGLDKKIQLFLLPDPEWRPNRDETSPRPVLIALPRKVSPNEEASVRAQQTKTMQFVKQASNVLGIAGAFGYGIVCYALNPKFFESVINFDDISSKLLVKCLPIVGGVLGIQAVNELAHRFVAKRRGIDIGWPLLLPSVRIGTFGCITPLKSFPPNRSALLDFALSGPLSATLLSLIFMMIGCYKTVYASQASLLNFPMIPVGVLKSSFLSGSILTFLLPKAMMLPLSQPIPIHPLFMVGFSGMLVSALNLLPIFRLDGGRACTAAMGWRIGAIASAWTLLSMFSLAFAGSGLAWTWGAFVLFCQRRPEIPCIDECTVVNDARVGLWIASFAAAVLALVPFPGGPGFL